MGYDAEIVRRARARLAAQRAESEQEQVRRTQEVYERFPRVKEIDQALRATVAQVVSAAFRTGEDPQRAVAQAQAENRKLQQERAWILEAAELGEDYLDPIVVCPTCGGTGFVGAEMCQCLKELCQDEQRKALSSLLGAGGERFEKFRLDYYPDQVDPKLGVSPGASCPLCWSSAAAMPRTSPATAAVCSSPASRGWERPICRPVLPARWCPAAFPSVTRRPCRSSPT